jgi:hypothetical protein
VYNGVSILYIEMLLSETFVICNCEFEEN